MRFPLTLGARGSCTIGGLTSTNAGGTQVLKFGTMRSLVAGVEAVLPDGSIHNGLSGLKKDNRGYSLDQLLIGAEGTLGVITAVALRLVPAVAARAVAWAGVESPAQALDLLRFLEARTDSVEGFELVPEDSLQLVLEAHPGHPRAAVRRASPGTCSSRRRRPMPQHDIAAELERLLGAALSRASSATRRSPPTRRRPRPSGSSATASRRPSAPKARRSRTTSRCPSPTCRASSSRPRPRWSARFPGVDRQRLRPSRRRQHPLPRPRRQPRRARLVRARRRGDHAPGRRPRHRRGRLDLRRARHRPIEARRIRAPRAARPHPRAARDQARARPARHHEPGEVGALSLDCIVRPAAASPLEHGSRADYHLDPAVS